MVDRASSVIEPKEDSGPKSRRPNLFRDSNASGRDQQRGIDLLRAQTLDYFYNFPDGYNSDFLKFGNSFAAIPSYGLSAEELVTVLTAVSYGLRNLPEQDRVKCLDLITARFDVVENEILKNLDGLIKEGGIQLLDALARLPVRPSVRFMTAIEEKLTQELSSSYVFLNKDLVFALIAYKKLGIQPSEAFMTAWENKAASLSGKFLARGASDILDFYAHMRIAPGPDFMAALERRIAQILPPSDHKLGVDPFAAAMDLSSMMASMAILDSLNLYDNAAASAKRIDACLRPLSGRTFKDGTIHQIHKARLWFGLETVFEMPTRSDDIRSETERKLAAFLRNTAQLNVLPEASEIKELKHLPDIEIHIPANGMPTPVNIIVEVDGPTHFTFRPDTRGERYVAGDVTGKTAFQSALIHKYTPGKPLLRLPFWVAEAMLEKRAWGAESFNTLIHGMRRYGASAFYAYLEDGTVKLDDIPIKEPLIKLTPAPSSSFAPVTDELIESLAVVPGRSGTGKIAHTPGNLFARAGFALGSHLPITPGELRRHPQPLDDFSAWFQQTHNKQGLIDAGLPQKEAPLTVRIIPPPAPSPDDTELAAVVAKAAAPRTRNGPAKEKPDVTLDDRKTMIEYLSNEPFFNGTNPHFCHVWEEQMTALPSDQALSMKDLIKILKAVAQNVRAIKYPDNQVQVRDYLAMFMPVWENPVMERMPHTNKVKTALLDMMTAFQSLEIRPGAEFCELMQDCAIRNIDNFQSKDLYTLLFAMAELGIQPTARFLDAWSKRAIDDDIDLIEDIKSPLDRANILWSAAVMHAMSGHSKMLNIGRRAHRSIADVKNLAADPKNEHPRRLIHACLWLDCKPLGPIPENMKNEGAFLKRMGDIFKPAVEGEINFDRRIPSLKRSADLAFRHGPDKREVLVQVDGPKYALRCSGETKSDKPASDLNGFGVLQSALICKVEQQATLFRIVGNIGPGQDFLLLSEGSKAEIARAIVAQSRNNGTTGAYAVLFNQAGEFRIERVPLAFLPECAVA